MFNMSASEGPKFAETANEMTERVRKLGPSPLKGLRQPERAAGPSVADTGAAASATTTGVSDKGEGETK